MQAAPQLQSIQVQSGLVQGSDAFCTMLLFVVVFMILFLRFDNTKLALVQGGIITQVWAMFIQFWEVRYYPGPFVFVHLSA